MGPHHLPARGERGFGRMRRAVAGASLLASIVALCLPGIAQAVSYPNNDDFVRQRALVTDDVGLPPGVSLTTDSSEPGEPSHGANGPFRSAWWSWTAPRSGLAEVQSCSNAFTPLLGVYVGFDIAQLTTVATTPSPARCQLPSSYPYGVARRFDAVQGTAYRIATATDQPADGYATAAVQMQPAGDDIANAEPFPAAAADVRYVALGLATVQPGEPAPGGRAATHSTWYAYTPDRPERVRIKACSANYTPVSSTVTVYRGSTLGALTAVASSVDAAPCGSSLHGGQVEALLDVGVAYRIAVTQGDPTAEPVRIDLEHSPLDDSATTPSKLESGSVDLALATHEPGEPDHAGQAGGRSRWEVVTPIVSTTYEVSTCGSSGDPVADSLLAVYEGAPGTPASDLAPVAANDDGCASGGGSLVRFRAQAGHRYLVAIDSKGGVPATVALAVRSSPPGDDRDSAVPFYGRVGSTSTALATAEPGEPDHAGSPAAHSIWFRWVAPASGNARVALCGASFDAVVAVYGVDATQSAIASAGSSPGCADPSFGSTGTGPQFDVPVTGGRAYLIAIDGRNGASGDTGQLSVSLGSVLNDDLADATSLADPTDADGDGDGEIIDVSSDATAQPGEPAHAGRAAEHSSWWRWTATRTGYVTVSTCSVSAAAGDDTTLAVYTGDSLAQLVPVAAADGGCGDAGAAGNAKLSFYAVEGTIYRVAVDLHATTTHAILRLSLPPGNDRFADARDITATGYANGDLDAATREPGEPDHAGHVGGRSVWYAWTAARSAPVEIGTCGDVDTLLAVYTGTAVDALHEVASDDDAADADATQCDPRDSRVRFVAQAGTTYEIAVDGKDGATGEVHLSVATAGAADRFATATDLGARPQASNGVDLSLTSAEPGEPAHGGVARRCARAGCASRRRTRTSWRRRRARRPPTRRSAPTPATT